MSGHMRESEPWRVAAEGPDREAPADCSPAEGPLQQAQPAEAPEKELSTGPLRERVKRPCLRGLVKTPMEAPAKATSKGAMGPPRTWRNHLRVPTREQVRGCSQEPGQAATLGSRKMSAILTGVGRPL